MKTLRLLAPALAAVSLAACATTTKPAAIPTHSSVLTPQSSRAESAEFRKSLEEAYDTILAREQHKSDAPEADIEAAASIPIPEHRTVRGALDYFTTRLHDSIQTSLLLSAKYKSMIDATLEAEGLPKGLAYLPVIESAYAQTLTSRAGAHGMWQFMPDTAREYGLRVDWWVDERADPEPSTRAAASYLKDLHRRFGDWSLALAAYNCGPGRVSRALAETGASTFWELLEMTAVPKETRGYVPTFYATLMIATDPATYGFTLREPEQPSVKRVDVDGPLSLDYVADAAGVESGLLREMNPALRRGLVPPGGASLRVPLTAASEIAARARTLKNDDANMKVCSFTLRGGDTIEKLARKLDTKPETILAMNGLSSGTEPRKGETLFLPVRARELGALLSHSDDRKVYYAVRKGDTLYSVARRHKLTVDELVELNDLRRGTSLRPGQRLRVAPGRGVVAGSG
ncbi:MAG: transglycosylase SLT domain-containing protein [Thermoanaerobaculia bacterium]|nr:transglycosylase SLT domain-containing protein [Thermoanaerobaculia bacterium]